jgi:hypothetical protein
MNLDIRAVLAEHEIAFTEVTKSYGTVLKLDRCLTSTEHEDGASITIMANGALAYRCHHASCAGKGWAEAKAALGLTSSTSSTSAPGSASPGAESRSKGAQVVLPPAPPFPLHVLPEPVRTYVDEAAAALGTTPSLVAVPFLAYTGAVIGRSTRLRIKSGFEQLPILWTATVAPPGSAKSLGDRDARAPLEALQHQAYAAYTAELSDWETQAKLAKDQKLPAPAKPVLEHFFTTDATLEALAPMVSDSVGVAMSRDELMSWIGSFDAYRGGRGGDRANWLTSWTPRSLKIDRKHAEPIVVEHPVICVVGGIQPQRLSELSAESSRGDGFLERILFDYPDLAPMGWSEATISLDAHLQVDALMRQFPSPARWCPARTTAADRDAECRGQSGVGPLV